MSAAAVQCPLRQCTWHRDRLRSLRHGFPTNVRELPLHDPSNLVLYLFLVLRTTYRLCCSIMYCDGGGESAWDLFVGERCAVSAWPSALFSTYLLVVSFCLHDYARWPQCMVMVRACMQHAFRGSAADRAAGWYVMCVSSRLYQGSHHDVY